MDDDREVTTSFWLFGVELNANITWENTHTTTATKQTAVDVLIYNVFPKGQERMYPMAKSVKSVLSR